MLISSHKYVKGAAALLSTFTLLNLATQASAADDLAAGNARGAELWATQCNRCHNMRDPVEFRDDQWRVIVAHMRVRAGLTGSQSADILAFLQASNSAYWDQAVVASVEVPESSEPGNLSPSPYSARDLYNRTCIACHGSDGKGAITGVPDLTSESGPLNKSDSDLRRSILAGIQNPKTPLAMPPKGGDPALTSEDAKQLVHFLRNEFGR